MYRQRNWKQGGGGGKGKQGNYGRKMVCALASCLIPLSQEYFVGLRWCTSVLLQHFHQNIQLLYTEASVLLSLITLLGGEEASCRPSTQSLHLSVW